MHELYIEENFKLLWDDYGAKVVVKQLNHKTEVWEIIEEEFCMDILRKLKARAELEDRMAKEYE